MSRTDRSQGIDRHLRSEVGEARRALVIAVALGVAGTVSVIAQLLFLARLLAWAGDPGTHGSAIGPLVGFLIALFARVALLGLSEALSARSATRVTSELRMRLLEHLEAQGIDGLGPTKRGAVVLSATRGLRALEPYYSRYLPAAVLTATAPVAALVVLGLLDWPSALLCLVLVALIPVSMIRLGRRAAQESERQWQRLSSMSARFLELLRGIPTLRALGATERGHREVIAANEALSESIDATLRSAMLSGAALEFLAGVGVGLVAMLAGHRLLHGGFSIPSALAVILLAPEVFLPLRRAGAEFHAATEGRAAGAQVLDEINSPATLRPEGTLRSSKPVTLQAQEVEVRRGETLVLAGVSLDLGEGAHLLLKGPSGAGKSTLLATLCGVLTPHAGHILLSGIDLKVADPQWRRNLISYVPQQPHVFAASLGENLSCFGPLDQHRALEALELVGLDHLLDEGHLDRPLAESGRSLSGGERQRLGLARAYLENRSIVLLDEPTAHLDQRTITALQSSLGAWLSERTVVEVAHHSALLVEAPILDLGVLR